MAGTCLRGLTCRTPGQVPAFGAPGALRILSAKPRQQDCARNEPPTKCVATALDGCCLWMAKSLRKSSRILRLCRVSNSDVSLLRGVALTGRSPEHTRYSRIDRACDRVSHLKQARQPARPWHPRRCRVRMRNGHDPPRPAHG